MDESRSHSFCIRPLPHKHVNNLIILTLPSKQHKTRKAGAYFFSGCVGSFWVLRISLEFVFE
jgi:hypothetical protein